MPAFAWFYLAVIETPSPCGAGSGDKVKHFSSDTVIGLIVSALGHIRCLIVPFVMLLWQYLLCPLVLHFMRVILLQHTQIVNVEWCETWF